MHCVSLSKLRRFFLPKLRCSPKKKKKKKKKKKGLSRNLNGFSVQMKVFSKKKKKKKVFTESETVFWQWCAQISRLFAQINRPFARIFDDFRRFEPNGGATAPPAPPPPTAMNGATKTQTFSPLTLDAWNFQDRQVWKKDKFWQNSRLPKWRNSSQTSTLKLNFNHLHYTDEIFRIGKYEEKIKCDKFWGYHNEGYLSNENAKIQTFLLFKLDTSNFQDWQISRKDKI